MATSKTDTETTTEETTSDSPPKRQKYGGRKKGSLNRQTAKKQSLVAHANLEAMRKKLAMELMREGRMMLQESVDAIREQVMDPLVALSQLAQTTMNDKIRLDALKEMLPYVYPKIDSNKNINISGTINYDDIRQKLGQVLLGDVVENEVKEVTDSDE